MIMNDIIVKKRDGKKISKEEIEFFVNGFSNGEIPDYQASAFLMAVYFQKMDFEETYYLTMAIEKSGFELDLSEVDGPTADKHSTGGVGDKTTLVLEPMMAALGVKMAKMSGRGLGFSGGTIDKLESFPGFETAIKQEDFISEVNANGLALTGQTGNLAPADKKIYGLRDVTGTVENISLIASSIMGKKLAAGAKTIVLDVKTGSGAFMKTEEDSIKLATTMVEIGKRAGRNTSAIISDMNQPLGYAIGNVLEVKEAIDALKGNGPSDLMELCFALGEQILLKTGVIRDVGIAKREMERVIKDGSALEKLATLVSSQGGNSDDVYDYANLPVASMVQDVISWTDGVVMAMESADFGHASVVLGGGRLVKGESIDVSVGIVLNKKCGDKVKVGDVLCTIHGNDKDKIGEAKKIIEGAYTFADKPVEKDSLIRRLIE